MSDGKRGCRPRLGKFSLPRASNRGADELPLCQSQSNNASQNGERVDAYTADWGDYYPGFTGSIEDMLSREAVVRLRGRGRYQLLDWRQSPVAEGEPN